MKIEILLKSLLFQFNRNTYMIETFIKEKKCLDWENFKLTIFETSEVPKLPVKTTTDAFEFF